MCAWEISEGDTKFLYAKKFVSSENLGFGSLKCQSIGNSQWKLSLSFLVLGDTKTLERILSFMKRMVNEHVLMDYVHSIKSFDPR